MRDGECYFGKDWFNAKQVEPDIWAFREPNHSEDVLSYLIKGSAKNVLIDTGMGLANFRDAMLGIVPDQETTTVLLTHSHWDHIGGANLFQKVSIFNLPYETKRLSKGWLPSEMCGFENEEFAIPVPANFSKDTFQVSGVLNFATFEDEQKIDLGDKHLSVIHTPGHTRGSVCFFLEERGLLFTGDTLYPGPEYLHLPESSLEHYKQSLETLFEKIGKRLKRIFPGHNAFSAEPELLARHLLALNGIIEPETIVSGQDFFGPFVEKKWNDFSIRAKTWDIEA